MSHYQDILDRLRDRQGRRDICSALKVSPRTVRQVRQAAVERGWLDSETIPTGQEVYEAVTALIASRKGESSSSGPSFGVTGLSDAQKQLMVGWLRKGYEIKTIHSALKRNHGYKGSYSTLWRLVQFHTATEPDVVVRLQFAPGDVAQVDFGSGPRIVDLTTGKERKTWFFVMTLAYSRHQYAEIVWDQGVDTWLRCHQRAFTFLGGVVSKVVIDNLKSAITKACAYDPQVQRSYAEFARGYGFKISPCVVETPEHKGRVEAGVKYIKRSFLNSPRQFRSLADANKQLREWILEEAGNRIHGTTQRQPLAMFAEEERSALKPLPADPVEIAVWKTIKLHPDCHIQFNRSYYSAPHRYVGKELDLRATPNQVQLFDQATMVACHPRAQRPGSFCTNMDHLPPEKTAHLLQTPQWCLEQARLVGENCHEFMAELLGDRVVDRLRAAQALLRLRKKYAVKRLEAACRRALVFGNIQYRAVKRILELGLDQVLGDWPIDESEASSNNVDSGPAPAQLLPRFARDIAALFRTN